MQDVCAPFGLLITTKGYSDAAKRRAAHFRGLSLDVVALDKLDVWLPRRPTVGWTEGSAAATVVWWDDDGKLRTDWVAREVAERLDE